MDLNVMSAWDQGYTGEGVTVTILDDGVDHDHPDIKRNYVSLNSRDGRFETKGVSSKHFVNVLIVSLTTFVQSYCHLCHPLSPSRSCYTAFIECLPGYLLRTVSHINLFMPFISGPS